METNNKEWWEESFDKEFNAHDFCGCYEGDLADMWPVGKLKLKTFISSLLREQREEMLQEIEGMKTVCFAQHKFGDKLPYC